MRLVGQGAYERGDTIIEVIFAVVVFSFVAVGSIIIMNQGIHISERALETTLVRQQINAQAEALRYVHQSRVVSPTDVSSAAELPTATDTWNRITHSSQTVGQASEFGASGSSCPAIPPKGFIMNARNATRWGGDATTAGNTPSLESGGAYPPFAQVVYDRDSNEIEEAYGIWIEAVPSVPPAAPAPGSSWVQFVDFHIRACWPSPGGSVPMTMGTIVRLYDPI